MPRNASSSTATSSDATPSATTIEFPLRGDWVCRCPPGHHPLALDFVGLKNIDGHDQSITALHHHQAAKITSVPTVRSWLGSVPVERYFGWGRPVFAPGPGTVLESQDGLADRRLTGPFRTVALWFYATFVFRPKIKDGKPIIQPNAGNHLLIKLDHGPVAFFAHLKCGSLTVKPGDRVEVGTEIGQVGNSGSTTAPHLHLHLLDQAHDLFSAQLLPFNFRCYEERTEAGWEKRSQATPVKNQILRNNEEMPFAGI